MNEQTKTLTYIGVALVVVAIAMVTRPSISATSRPLGIPDVLNDIDNPLVARSMQITEYDEATSTLREFAVAEVDELWTIPSHENYPADAESQMGEAASSVMNLKVLDMVSTDRSRHADYGVVDLDIRQLRPGATGVGTRVIMENAQGEQIVHMVIGKQVKDQTQQRYVRQVGRDAVYVVKVDPSKLSTKFEDWIEDDLLKLSTLDIKQIELKDYSASMELVVDQGGFRPVVSWDRRSEMTVAYDGTKSDWSLATFRLFDSSTKQMVDTEISEDQELDTEVLNDLRDALDDLKIVDVARKPEGMSRDLKASADFLNNREALASLQSKGYLPVPLPESQNEVEILSAEGEVICQMKSSVEYVLRFGSIAGDTADDGAGETSDTGLNRYIFLLARYNDDVITQPTLAELPDLPEAKPESVKDAATKDAAGEGEVAEKPSEGEPAEEIAEQETDGAAAEDAAENDTDETETTDEADADGTDAAESDEKSIEAITAERKEIEKENQEKLDEYNKKVKEAKEQVQKLNDRFGDWYFIIPDNVYQKIHLSHSTIIKQKDPPEDEAKDDEGDPLQ